MPVGDDPVSVRLANLQPAPPAPLGNRRALTHGAYVTFKTLREETEAAAIYEGLAVETPLRDGDGGLPIADRAALELLAGCLARLAPIGEYIEKHGPLDGKGRPRPVLEVERRLRNEAREHLRDLGLTPRARVVLGLSLQRGAGLTLAELLAEIEPGEGGG